MKYFVAFILGFTLLLASAMEPVVDFVTPSIVRVRWDPDNSYSDNATGACIYKNEPVAVEIEKNCGMTVMKSDSLIVEIPAYPGGIRFIDRVSGKVLLKEVDKLPRVRAQIRNEVKITYDEASAHMEETANGKVTVKNILSCDTVGERNMYVVGFLTGSDEGIYGLGSHMEDYMNLLGKKLYLTQHNLKAFVPVLVSTGGYGLLFDAGCSMIYDSRPAESGDEYEMRMKLQAAKVLDYYFIKGVTPADVIGGYRYLTGEVSLPPLYALGYIQSKERYISSDDIVNTVREYRRRHVPLDMIVQDWNYWPQGWGYMKMNRDFYPDPKALADSVHALDAKLMVSIWANPQYCPEEQDFRARGFMLEHSVYDAFNPAARDLYWQYADNEFFSNGFDAWWCDSSEPLDGDWNQLPEPENGRPYSWDDHERRWRLNDDILSETLGAERACLYSLNHSRGIYEHQRSATDRKRVVNLTRSTFAGQQRYGTIVWNGDTHASWESFRQQIPAGLNYMATGNPYWTVDVGSFFTRSTPQWFCKGEFPDGVKDDGYKEYYTRMFQWATFLPVLRSHGTDTPREIWQFGEPGSPFYDAILSMIKQRYSLLPYIYSMAAMQHTGNYTMARPLAFDFPGESRVYDIKDQYMFGDIMVCPVIYPGATTREVYLPDTAGGWIDFYTGNYIDSGKSIIADAPISTIPLYVRAGSIIITAPPVEHSGQLKGLPLDITVYPGRDCAFTFYEDSGDSYDFEKGESLSIKFSWDDARRHLTLSDDGGTYEGAPSKRKFNIKIGDRKKTIEYTPGKSKTVRF